MNDNLHSKVDWKQLKTGDEAAFKSLFKDYYVPLCLYSVQITESLDDSEDIVQDFFLRFWEKEFYKDVDSNLKSYLFTSIRNLSLNYLKKHRNYLFEELEEITYLSEDECSESELCDMYHHLHEAFYRLSSQEARALRSVIFEGKTYKEVALDMGISVNTVKTYLSRAMRYLRNQLLFLMFILYFIKFFRF